MEWHGVRQRCAEGHGVRQIKIGDARIKIDDTRSSVVSSGGKREVVGGSAAEGSPGQGQVAV